MLDKQKAVLILALLGLADALYLALAVPGCSESACGSVHASAYGFLFGVPVAWYGVLGYLLLAGLAVAGMPYILALLGAGLLFEARLVWAQFAVLHDTCPYCLYSAGIWLAAALCWTLPATDSFRKGLIALAVVPGAYLAATHVLPQPQVEAAKTAVVIEPGPAPESGSVLMLEGKQAGKLVLEDAQGDLVSVPEEQAVLLFSARCSHCTAVLEEVGRLAAHRRPVLAGVALMGEDKAELVKKARGCALDDPVYFTSGMPPQAQEVPAVVRGGEVVAAGEKGCLAYLRGETGENKTGKENAP